MLKFFDIVRLTAEFTESAEDVSSLQLRIKNYESRAKVIHNCPFVIRKFTYHKKRFLLKSPPLLLI
jgi:hypothetical protein